MSDRAKEREIEKADRQIERKKNSLGECTDEQMDKQSTY